MAIQFLPILKAVVPYIAQIATATIPAFTSKKGQPHNEDIQTDPIVTKQIEELQDAVSHNANSVKVLAEKLQQTIENIETAAQIVEVKITRYKTMIFISISLSIVSSLLCLVLLLR